MTDSDRSTRPAGNRANGWDEGLRVLSVSLVGVIVFAGLLGFLGARTTTATTSANGFSMEVAYASITRPGLAAKLDLKVATADGSPLPAAVTTRIASAYLAMLDMHGLEPLPASSFRTDEWTWWTFDVPPDTSLLELRLDARMDPGVQWGQKSTAAVEVDGEEVVAVEFETWVLP
jgi:hypothetical protein